MGKVEKVDEIIGMLSQIILRHISNELCKERNKEIEVA